MKWAEMNEKGISKPDIVNDFKFRSKCMFGAELRKESIESLSAPRLHFQATNASQTFGGRAPPGPAGELKRSHRPLVAVGRIITISSRSLVPIAGKEEGEWMCVEWAEMNERGIF